MMTADNLVLASAANEHPSDDRSDFLHAVDRHVGKRLRLRRLLLGMTQSQLGDASGLVFQQIQKYERGSNRIGAGRLYQFARLLCVDVGWFYQDMPAELQQVWTMAGFSDNRQVPLEGAPSVNPIDDLLLDRDLINLVRTYSRIGDPRQKDSLRRLIETMAVGLPESGKN